MTLNNLAILLEDIGDYAGARADYEEALKTYRELARKQPDVYLPDVAMTLNNLGVLLQKIGDYAGARADYEEALKIYRELARKQPDVYLPYVAGTLNNLGLLTAQESETSLAIQQLTESLEIREELFRKHPTVHGIDASKGAIPLAILYYTLLESTGDLEHRTKGLDLLEKARKFLAVYKEPIPQVIQYQKMIEEYTQKFQSYNPEDQAIKERLRPLKAAVNSAGSPHEKVQRQQELIQELEALRIQFPLNGSLPTLLASAHGSLAWHHLFDQGFGAAEGAARKGLQLAPDETWIYTNLALALLYQGRWDEAKEIYLRLKDQPYGEATYGKTFLEDLDALEKAGITHPDVEKARRLLR